MAEMTSYQQDIKKATEHLTLPQQGNILVTGATGLIGGCLVDMLMQHSLCHVYAMGRNIDRARTRFRLYSCCQ